MKAAFSFQKPLGAINNAVFGIYDLARSQTAARVLPPTTRFVIVARLIEIDPSSPFDSSSVLGIYVVYIALIGPEIVIYRGDGTIIAQALISDVSVDRNSRTYEINIAQKRFRVQTTQSIPHLPYTSKTSLWNKGLNPLFDALEEYGATVDRMPIRTNILTSLLLLGMLIAAFYFGFTMNTHIK